MATIKNLLNVDESQRWLLSRYDNWRTTIATRCSLVLSADAFLLAAHTLLLYKIIEDKIGLLAHGSSSIVISLLLIDVFFLAASLYYATVGIANVWQPSRSMFGKKMPFRSFFHPSDTIKDINSYEEMKEKYLTMNDKELENAYWAELWTLAKMHDYRYQHLRLSIKLLVVVLPVFLCSLTIVAVNSICK